MNTAVEWAAELAHVREVSLLGTADLAYWRDRLLKEDLLPAERDGGARLWIAAADSKYMGVRFRELSFSVLVSWSEEGFRHDAAYLARAFNSCRLFAVCERVLFSSPYSHGDVRVLASLPASIHLAKKGEIIFRAEMGAEGSGADREPSRRGEGGWEGPVFLPGIRRGNGRPGKWFFARLKGDTRTYPFLHSEDTVAIGSPPDSEILQALRDSHFVAEEWVVREDASHAKSKTRRRPDVIRGEAAEPVAAPDPAA